MSNQRYTTYNMSLKQIKDWYHHDAPTTSKTMDSIKCTRRGCGFIIQPNIYLDNAAIWSHYKCESAKLYHRKKNKGRKTKWGIGCPKGRKKCWMCRNGKCKKSINSRRKNKYNMKHET